MRLPRFLVFPLFLVALLVVLQTYANPGLAACAIADASNTTPAHFEELLIDSKSRIETTFGAPQSTPIVIFLDESNAIGPFKLNSYGSTQFLGAKVCVMIGTEGRNTDVVAHELMHAEIASRVGYWRRFTQIPVWFDEGLAMQVDYRPRYELSADAAAHEETAKVTALWSASDFFVEDDELLTSHYAYAKAEVAEWVGFVGRSSVYSQLARIGDGEDFEALINRQ